MKSLKIVRVDLDRLAINGRRLGIDLRHEIHELLLKGATSKKGRVLGPIRHTAALQTRQLVIAEYDRARRRMFYWLTPLGLAFAKRARPAGG